MAYHKYSQQGRLEKAIKLLIVLLIVLLRHLPSYVPQFYPVFSPTRPARVFSQPDPTRTSARPDPTRKKASPRHHYCPVPSPPLHSFSQLPLQRCRYRCWFSARSASISVTEKVPGAGEVFCKKAGNLNLKYCSFGNLFILKLGFEI